MFNSKPKLIQCLPVLEKWRFWQLAAVKNELADDINLPILMGEGEEFTPFSGSELFSGIIFVFSVSFPLLFRDLENYLLYSIITIFFQFSFHKQSERFGKKELFSQQSKTPLELRGSGGNRKPKERGISNGRTMSRKLRSNCSLFRRMIFVRLYLMCAVSKNPCPIQIISLKWVLCSYAFSFLIADSRPLQSRHCLHL